jgi:DnaJ-class molecular chaperone
VGTHQGQINVEIQIPPGIEDGDTVRYARVGPNGMDLVITFRIHPDLTWRREGANSIRKFDISIWALILGQEITVDTIHKNQVVVSVPPKTQPGATLRIRGHGFPRKGTSQRGDLMVELNAKLPTDLTPEQIEQIRHWNSQ